MPGSSYWKLQSTINWATLSISVSRSTGNVRGIPSWSPEWKSKAKAKPKPKTIKAQLSHLHQERFLCAGGGGLVLGTPNSVLGVGITMISFPLDGCDSSSPIPGGLSTRCLINLLQWFCIDRRPDKSYLSEISKEVRLESINCRARLGRELRAARGDALGRHTPTCSKKVL